MFSSLFIVTDRKGSKDVLQERTWPWTKPMSVRGVSIYSQIKCRQASSRTRPSAHQEKKINLWGKTFTRALFPGCTIGTNSTSNCCRCRQNNLHPVLVVNITLTSSISLTGIIHTGRRIQSLDSTRNTHFPHTRVFPPQRYRIKTDPKIDVSGHIEATIRYPTGY